MIKYFSIIIGLLLAGTVHAQDYGLEIGIHQSTASYNSSDSSGWLAGASSPSISGALGFDLGVHASFDLVPNLKFRTGIMYDVRPFQFKTAAGNLNINYAYIDVPVDVQYNFNDMFGIFGGLVVGIKAGDSYSAPGSWGSLQSDNMKSLYPLVNVGANFTFDNMIGFDVYYEYGLGDFADNLKNYSTFGLRFIYWL